MESGQRFFFIVEGDLRDAGRLYGNALSLTVKQHVRGIPLIRTWDIQETFASLIMLIEKMENPPGILVQSGIRLPPRSKRAREASPQTCFARMLRCVPGCWDTVTAALVKEFKTLPALQKALSSDRVPRLELANGKLLGKTRWKRLRAYLLDDVTLCSPAKPEHKRTDVTASSAWRAHVFRMCLLVSASALSTVAAQSAPREVGGPWNTTRSGTASTEIAPSRRWKLRTSLTARGCCEVSLCLSPCGCFSTI